MVWDFGDKMSVGCWKRRTHQQECFSKAIKVLKQVSWGVLSVAIYSTALPNSKAPNCTASIIKALRCAVFLNNTQQDWSTYEWDLQKTFKPGRLTEATGRAGISGDTWLSFSAVQWKPRAASLTTVMQRGSAGTWRRNTAPSPWYSESFKIKEIWSAVFKTMHFKIIPKPCVGLTANCMMTCVSNKAEYLSFTCPSTLL